MFTKRNVSLIIVFVSYILFTSIVFIKKGEGQLSGVGNSPGKVYLYDNHLFINSMSAGINIYNVGNSSNPVHKSHIDISRSVDLAVNGNYLYADSGGDLNVYDISDISEPELISTLKELFYDHHSGDFSYGDSDGSSDGRSGVFMCFGASESSKQASPPASSGQGGSMARFAISGGFLYCVNGSNLITVSLEEPDNPEKIDSIYVGFNIETIFPHEEYLFIGSQTGMFIYSILNPELPAYVSEFSHARACDPVVVSGEYAFVTLRAGSNCGGTSDQMDILNMSDISNPVLLKSYGLSGPYGLGVDPEFIYICDGADGVRIIDWRDPDTLNQVNLINDDIGFAYDVILSSGKVLYISTSKGIYLYDVLNIQDVKFLSWINYFE